MNPLLISALVSAAVAFGAAWQIQDWRIDSLKLGYANERLAIEQSSRQQLNDAQAKVTAAQDAAKVANDRIRRDAANLDRSSIGLRDTLANAVRTAHTDLQTCTRQVDALSVVFSECTGVARTMAAEADSWAVQAVTIQEAWPTSNHP